MAIFKIFVILFFLFYLSVSIATMINPYLVWKIFESWKSVKEPSSVYFLYNRIIGGIATLFGLYMLISFIKAFF